MIETELDAVHPRFSGKPLPKIGALKIALVQMAVGADKTKNIAEAVRQIHLAKAKGAELVALPECFNSPYGTKYFMDYAEEIPCGATCQALSKAAADTQIYVVGGTIPEICNDKIYNTCTVWNRLGSLEVVHRKMHLFDIDIPGQITFKESDVLSPGDQFATFSVDDFMVGLGICYDMRFPEMARILVQKGCSFLLYPGAFNMTTGPKHWELLSRGRAVDEQVYVAAVSPARDEGAGYVAWGHTTLVDPWGAVVGKLDEKPGMLLADIDINEVTNVRKQIPIKKQRRTDLYDTIVTAKCS